jgi:hypothetical protein
VNNLANDDDGVVPCAYGPNWNRLVDLKRRYDPDNTFHLNHNIDPSTSQPKTEQETMGSGVELRNGVQSTATGSPR